MRDRCFFHLLSPVLCTQFRMNKQRMTKYQCQHSVLFTPENYLAKTQSGANLFVYNFGDHGRRGLS